MKKWLPKIIALILSVYTICMIVVWARGCSKQPDKNQILEDSIRIYGQKAEEYAIRAEQLQDSSAHYHKQYEKAKDDYNNSIFPGDKLDSLREVYRTRVYEDVRRQLADSNRKRPD